MIVIPAFPPPPGTFEGDLIRAVLKTFYVVVQSVVAFRPFG